MDRGRSSGSQPPIAVVLAAGKGTRLRSDRPKVLHRVAGRPMLSWVLEAVRDAGCERVLVVIGHGADDVRASFSAPDVEWVEQREQLGTGHALARVRDRVPSESRLLVVSGDAPLIRQESLRALLAAAEEGWGALAVAELERPGTLGRVEIRPDGTLSRIVEAVDASPEELAIRTINAGAYALPARDIFSYLDALRPDNAKGELYLTDALESAARDHRVRAVCLQDSQEARGINDRADLAAAQRALVERHVAVLQARGVTFHAPETALVEPGVEVGRDSEIHAGVTLTGSTVIGENCVLYTGVWIRDSRVAAGTVIWPYSVLDGAEVREAASVGPFARLRPGADVGPEARIGNFVEVKNSRLGAGVRAGHLTYLGDTEVGQDANIGAGTITCNYDGEKKHPTIIGRRAFIGSDTMLVAPVEVGEGAVTGAGSVITEDVPAGALGVGRARQRNIEEWRSRRRKKEEKG